MKWQIQPIHISHTSGVPKEYVKVVEDSVKNIVELSEVDLPIKNLGLFNTEKRKSILSPEEEYCTRGYPTHLERFVMLFCEKEKIEERIPFALNVIREEKIEEKIPPELKRPGPKLLNHLLQYEELKSVLKQPPEEFKSADWYIRSSWDIWRQQADASKITWKLATEPQREAEPHYDVLITGVHLFDSRTKDNNYVCGLTHPTRATVQSYYVFDKLYEKELVPDMLGTVILHETSHMFNAPRKKRKSVVDTYGGYHCTNKGCALEQFNNPGWPNLDDLTKTRKGLGMTICKECAEDVKYYFTAENPMI